MMDIDTAWDTLYKAAKEMENPGGDWEVKLATVMAAVELFLDFPPQEMVTCIDNSDLPTRAVMSWLVFEGGRLPGVDSAKVEDLRCYWESICSPGQGIQKPPQGTKLV